jgi:hypothetical protein
MMKPQTKAVKVGAIAVAVAICLGSSLIGISARAMQGPSRMIHAAHEAVKMRLRYKAKGEVAVKFTSTHVRNAGHGSSVVSGDGTVKTGHQRLHRFTYRNVVNSKAGAVLSTKVVVH